MTTTITTATSMTTSARTLPDRAIRDEIIENYPSRSICSQGEESTSSFADDMKAFKYIYSEEREGSCSSASSNSPVTKAEAKTETETERFEMSYTSASASDVSTLPLTTHHPTARETEDAKDDRRRQQVAFPPSLHCAESSFFSSYASKFHEEGIRVNIRYRNPRGRRAIISSCARLHCDFGQFNSVVSVTLPLSAVPALADDPDIEWCGGDGVVRYCYVDKKDTPR